MEQSGKNKIHIALGFDNNYIVHVYAMVTSIFHNNRQNKIYFHVVATGLSNEEKNDFKYYIKQNNAQVAFYDIPEFLLNNNITIPANTHFTAANLYRLFFPALLDTTIKKLLYIDTDTIIIGDLQPLFDYPLGNAALGAVPDSHFPHREELGITGVGNYFNAGILLIDLDNWRDQRVSENVIQFIVDNPDKTPYIDQDGLNVILKNKWVKLDIKYNFTLADVKLQVPTKELIRDVVIVHYTSYRKPWILLNRNKLRYLYHYYLKLSPKSRQKKYTDFRWDINSLWTFMRIRLKEFYFDYRINKLFPSKRLMNSSDLDY